MVFLNPSLSVKILDCTLRDGGYINDWHFGSENIKKMLLQLRNSYIDIIECGFLTNKGLYNCEFSKFNNLESISKLLPVRRDNSFFVCMLNYGEYDVENLPYNSGSSVDGIRVAFHKKDMLPALQLCSKIKEKGYKVFIQAMVSLSYSDEEFLRLIHEANKINPYAFYIVDSFGAMKQENLLRLFRLTENNLNPLISIGYHSHNNLQLAFSNSQSLLREITNHNLIIDSSVFGMGRGAGNLNTELIVGYMNDYYQSNYFVKPLLIIIDEVLNNIYSKFFWGYSLPHYLSATHNCHPNYASHLEDKKTLTVDAMDAILSLIPEDGKNLYDSFLIEQLYLQYQSRSSSFLDNLSFFKSLIQSRPILLIGPGKSVETQKDTICNFMDEKNPISISINFVYTHKITSFIFTSNLRRYQAIPESERSRMIVTSNIPNKDVYLQTNYSDLLNDIPSVKDNAGILLIQFLINCGAKEVYLAGIDGYSVDAEDNFASSDLLLMRTRSINEAVNMGIQEMLNHFKTHISIKFLTKSLFK